MIDIDQVEGDLQRLVAIAIDAAGGLDELSEAARAAAAVGTPALLQAVAAKIADEVAQALTSAGAWETELTYSKIDAWAHTGHRAKVLAEAWGIVAPGLRAAAAEGTARSGGKGAH